MRPADLPDVTEEMLGTPGIIEGSAHIAILMQIHLSLAKQNGLRGLTTAATQRCQT